LILEYNKEGNNATSLQDIIDSNHHWFSGVAQQALKNQQAKIATGFSDWYEWSYANWGVKWDASNLKIKELSDFNTIVFSFNSPWGTPTKFVEELSKMYPHAIFELVAGSIENNRSEEHTSELQSLRHLVCRLLLETRKETDRQDILYTNDMYGRRQSS